MKYISFILLMFSFQFVLAQEIMLKKGAVVDSLPINDSIAENFSLYLPSDFSQEKAWPVLFVFDTDGRGRSAAQLLRLAAEEQGYIIAASNDISTDSSLVSNVKVGTRLMNRVFDLLPIARNGIYAAGFSEGAKAASALPTVFPELKGVIAIGDTWINPDFIRKGAKFSFIGLVGYKDYRNFVMEETTEFFKRAGIPAALYKYEGGHEWPGGDMAGNALAGLTLEAMAKGFRPRDTTLVEKLYQNDIQTAESLRRKMQHYKAYQYLEKIIPRYEIYGKKKDISQHMRSIRKEKTFKQQRRAYNRAQFKEEELIDLYIYYFTEDVRTANFENLGWWSQQIKELQEMQEGDNQAEAEMAHRLEGLLESMADATFTDLKEANASIDPMIFTAILQTIFAKEDPEGYMNIISLSAQDGDYYTALLYLEDLLKTGYKDMESLYNIPGTLDLKLSPEYNELIKKYLGESKYYDTSQ